jgi:uncharacterized protein with HEPN domain
MTSPRLADYIDHMLEATEQALIYVEGLPKEDFLEDKCTQQAVVLNLIVIGEASTKISKDYGEFAENNRQVPWASMRGMRNRIAHGFTTLT